MDERRPTTLPASSHSRIVSGLLALALGSACSLSDAPTGQTSSGVSEASGPNVTVGIPYRVVSVLTGQVLDVNEESTAPGARVQQWPSWDGPNQHWTLQGTAAGYALIASHSGSCLDVPGDTLASGAPLEQWPCDGGINQRFTFVPVPGQSGEYSIVGAGSHLCLDVRGGSEQPGTIVQQWGCAGSSNQRWRLEEVATPPNVLAAATGVVEVFVNGTSIGKSGGAGELLTASANFVAGENTVALRATAGAGLSQVRVQASGVFGTFGTSTLWITRPAVGVEATESDPSWAQPGADATGWTSATDTSLAAPDAFPPTSVAEGIWNPSAPAGTVLFRTVLYVPPGEAAVAPTGFAQGVTGGAGGETVQVTTPSALAAALCATESGGVCTDTTPRIIEVPSQVFDFTGSEGSHAEPGCVVNQCAAAVQSEYILNSLGACDASAGTPAKATFDVTVDNAGTDPLLVGANKTVIGLGAGATLRGKGLLLHDVNNVIVRNLTITGINPRVVWGGDALTLDGVDGVWIDHNRFSLIGRQMLVTGFGAATHVTVSRNEFDGTTPYGAYCDGKHYWVMLVLGSSNTMTVSENWIHDTSGRGPHAGGMENAAVTMQLADNLYETIPGFAANPETPLAKLLMEANVFDDVTTPVLLDSTGGLAFAPTSTSEGAVCQSSLGRACAPNSVSGASTAASSLPLDTPVLSPFTGLPAGSVIAPYPATYVTESVPQLAGPGHI